LGLHPNPAIPGPFQGNAQRLTNGNTFVGWGGLGNLTPAACTEVAGTNVVFQMKFNNSNVVSYRSYRFPYPPETQDNQASMLELSAGNSYTFGTTGVSMDVVTGGGGYNNVTVTREPYAPVYPLFQGKAPRVLPVRVKISAIGVNALSANINFDANSFGLSAPANFAIAYRSQSGQGLFLPLTSSYNPATGKLQVAMNLVAQAGDFGEFIFTYPDLPDVSYPPLLAQVENYRGVQPLDIIAPRLALAGETYPAERPRRAEQSLNLFRCPTFYLG
jgi:hypothetical protein